MSLLNKEGTVFRADIIGSGPDYGCMDAVSWSEPSDLASDTITRSRCIVSITSLSGSRTTRLGSPEQDLLPFLLISTRRAILRSRGHLKNSLEHSRNPDIIDGSTDDPNVANPFLSDQCNEVYAFIHCTKSLNKPNQGPNLHFTFELRLSQA